MSGFVQSPVTPLDPHHLQFAFLLCILVVSLLNCLVELIVNRKKNQVSYRLIFFIGTVLGIHDEDDNHDNK